ncbi:Initiator Replication protein [Orenia metallireducens]|uniref:Initiator Replication protein n=1 Tax=Orenia metallireducens TaxID=1413210 RepID=A0A285I2Q2_9FIRM|nr:replication initiation protein [Orenia metallireducens]SNY41356.1 Initiator Replication protein [Orenia metallireducens]
MKREMLNKPNQLIALRTKTKITVIQRKIYNIFLKIAQKEVKFSNYEEIIEDKIYSFEVDCDIVHRIAGVKIKDLKYIEEELENLMGMIATIRDEDNRENWDKFSILPRIIKEDNRYKFMLLGNIVKALQEQNYFTPLNLMMIKSLVSQYSIIFYELAIRYKKYKIPKMSIEEVRKLTNTEDEYNRFYDFRRRVLDTACEEISEKTDIVLSYKTEKKGRRIAFIDFEIEKKEELSVKLEAKVKEPEEYSPETLELFNLLPKAEQVESNKRELAQLLAEHSFRYLKADIDYTKKAQPDNFMGFLKASCQSGHYSSAELEKEEIKKELAKKREEAEKKKKELEKRIKKKAREMALERYEMLSEVELESHNQEYEKMTEVVPEKFRPNKEDFIIGALEDKFKKELKELFS